MVFVVSNGSARSPVWRARSSAPAISSPSNIKASATGGSMGCFSRAACGRILRFGRLNMGSNGSCSKRLGSRQAEMAYLLLLPVFAGLLFWWVSRNDRRQEFMQQRLRSLTQRGEPIVPALHRLEQVATSALIPQNLRVPLAAEFEAAGNR